MLLPRNGHLLVIIGPSGTGKSSVVASLQRQGLVEVAHTWTTRPPRPGEQEGSIEHKFISEKEFEDMDRKGLFLETVKLFGLNYRYGMPKIELTNNGKVPVIMLRAPLVKLLPKHYTNFVTYQIEGNIEQVKNRLAQREQMGEQTGTRLDDFEKETNLGRNIADRVFVNDTLDKTVLQVATALVKDFV